ncbi:MAG: transposase [Gemmataceae bacterium]
MPQSLAQIYIHAIFSTNNREPVRLDSWRDELFTVLGGIANNIGCQTMLVGGVADHVHHLFRLSRTITIADAVGRLKANSSLWVNQHQTGDAPFHWQGGYAAFTISQSKVETVREYIRRQPEHHRTESFQDELRTWLREYEVEWDERYAWD